MIDRLRSECGQALVVTALFMTATIGGTALTLDVGSWYREKRQAQTVADAAALSGAESLPADPAAASAAAQAYADKNGGTIDAAGGITFRSDYATNDTLVVKVHRPTEGFFSSLFGIVAPNVDAKAAARTDVPQSVVGAAPIAVNVLHPDLRGAPGCPCFDVDTTIPLDPNGAPGSFTLVNLDQNNQGTTGASTVADWVLNGFSGELPVGVYLSDPGAKWNNNSIDDALTTRLNERPIVLLPVYDSLTLQGANAEYHIIGWAAFYVTSFTATGTSGSITGHFVKVIWDGIQSDSGPGGPDFGVHSVALVN